MTAVTKSVQDSVCLNHPNVPAVTRCTTCFKPICGACVITALDRDFCSDECVRSYTASRENVEAYAEDTRRRRKKGLFRLLVKLVILIAVVAAAYQYFGKNPDDLAQLKKKAAELAEKGKDIVAVNPMTIAELSRTLDELESAWQKKEFDNSSYFFANGALYLPFGSTTPVPVGEFVALVSNNMTDSFSLTKKSQWVKIPNKEHYAAEIAILFRKEKTGGSLNRLLRARVVLGKSGGRWKIGRVKALSPLKTIQD